MIQYVIHARTVESDGDQSEETQVSTFPEKLTPEDKLRVASNYLESHPTALFSEIYIVEVEL